jgi:alpha-beta hydrolase superfamily lysophospholipase
MTLPGFQHHTATFEGASRAPIFYQRWLPADGVRRGSVVIVHGLGEHSGRYVNLVNCLLPEGYAIYAADHQGFGRSSGRRGHVAHFADYLLDMRHVVEMAHAEQTGLPLAIFGHSMGGLISLQYVLAYADTLDFLVLSAPGLRANFPKWLIMLLKLINFVYPTFTIRRPGDPSVITRDPDELRRFLNDPLHVPINTARFATEGIATQINTMQRAEEITVPVLMIHGMADQFVDPKATQEFYNRVSSQDKTLLLYEGYYHELHNDLGKEKPLGDVVQWLNERMGDGKR